MICPKCKTELPENSVACFQCGHSFKKRNWYKYLFIGIPVIIILIAAYFFINHQLKLSEINQKLEEAIGKDAGYTETIIKVEKDASSITYQELFDLCDKSIEGRTELIVELRGLYPSIESETKNKLIDFLNYENELIRNKKQFYRKQLSFSSALESYKEHSSDFPSSSYGWDYYFERSRKLRTEMVNAATEMKTNADQFINAYSELLKKEKHLKVILDKAGIRFQGFFQKYENEYIKLAEDAKELADKIKS